MQENYDLVSCCPMSPTKPSERELTILITDKCNGGCRYCDIRNNPNACRRLSNKMLKSLDAFIANWQPSKILLSGGEPLLSLSLMDVIKMAQDANVRISISTNGILLNRKMIHQITKTETLRHFNLSLDADNERIDDALRGKGHYNSMAKTMMLLESEELPYHVQVTVSRTNALYVASTVDFCLDHQHMKKVKVVPIAAYSDIAGKLALKSHHNSLLQKMLYYYRRYNPERVSFRRVYFPDLPLSGCNISPNSITITHTGDAYLCPWAVLPSFNVGNILMHSPYEIEQHAGSMIEHMERLPSPKCEGCKAIASCKFGCPAVARQYFQCVELPDPLCFRISRIAQA